MTAADRARLEAENRRNAEEWLARCARDGIVLGFALGLSPDGDKGVLHVLLAAGVSESDAAAVLADAAAQVDLGNIERR